MNASMKSFEMQVDQLANVIKNQSDGEFPSDKKQNPRDQCKAIMLKSRKEVESSKPWEVKGKEVEVEEEPPKIAPKSNSISLPDNPLIITPPLPFPQWFQKKKLDNQFSKFLELFKKIHINIPFADALKQIPNYAKFMKEVIRIGDWRSMRR